MPSYYAHELFGAEVMERLPSDCAEMVTNGFDGWKIGLFGPDPLMLHPKTNKYARLLHRLTTADAISRLAASFQNGDNEAAGFAAGLLCHHALDSACHPGVLSMANTKFNHAAIEAEFDQYLLRGRGYGRLSRALISVPRSPSVFASASKAWPGITPGLYKLSFAAFRKSMDFLSRASGTPLSRAYNAVTGRIKPLQPLHGALAAKLPVAELTPACQRLERVMTDNIDGTVILITGVLRLMQTRDFFQLLPKTNFYGAKVGDA